MSEYGPLVAGLDPGMTGGLALLSLDGQEFQAAYPFPETERELGDLIAEYAPHIQRAWLEQVHSMPMQGVASTFKFGMSYGLLRGLLIAHKIPWEDIRPEKWVKELGLKRAAPGRPTKRLHLAWAQQWFPRLQISHSTADAVLIAEYGRRQMAPPPLFAANPEVVHAGAE